MSNKIYNNSNLFWWRKNKNSSSIDFFKNKILKETDAEEKRVQQIRNYLLQNNNAELSLERAEIITNTYKKYENEHPAIKKSKAFCEVMKKINIPIVPEQLFIGSPNSGYGKIEVDVEYMTGWLLSEVNINGKKTTELNALNKRHTMKVEVSKNQLQKLEKEILPYWKNKYLGYYVDKKLLSENLKTMEYIKNSKVFMANYGKGFSHTIQDYNTVLNKGLKNIKLELQQKINTLEKNKIKNKNKIINLKAMIICADAVILYANRCAEKLLILAEREKNTKRKKELKTLAEICKKVPENSATNWWEALQSFHFLHLATFLAEGGVSHSGGRMDLYLYPYLKKDLLSGVITKKRAQELLECFFLKWFEYQTIRDYKSSRGLAGDRTNDKITIGGLNEKQKDITNELSYMLLEAHSHTHLKEPNLSVRLHNNTPEKFLNEVLKVIKLGSGLPQIINDEVIIKSLNQRCKVNLNDAYNYADIGCQENVTDPNSSRLADTNGHNNSGFFNLPKVIELTINNGKNVVNNFQVGPKTCEVLNFKTMPRFITAFKKQLQYAVKQNVLMNYAVEESFAKYFPCVYHSLMHPGPRNTGIDFTKGGCKYNWIGAVGVGLATTADCLSAIEYLIYKTKKANWNDFEKALKNNWIGYELLRKICLKEVPKFGEGDGRAEYWATQIVNWFKEEFEKYKTPRGGKFVIGFFTMGIHSVLGEDVTATPDGRKNFEILSGSVAPSHYAKSEPTLAHLSAARIGTLKTPNGVTFNQVFSQATLNNQRDINKWAQLIKTYIKAGGQSVQYSIVNRDELIAAQKNPQNYQDLIVRIGGYSSRFIDLTPTIQNDLILRCSC